MAWRSLFLIKKCTEGVVDLQKRWMRKRARRECLRWILLMGDDVSGTISVC